MNTSGKNCSCKYFFILYFVVLTGWAARENNMEHPNIVFILADDLGYGDISCLNENGKIPTPSQKPII